MLTDDRHSDSLAPHEVFDSSTRIHRYITAERIFPLSQVCELEVYGGRVAGQVESGGQHLPPQLIRYPCGFSDIPTQGDDS